MTAVETTSAPEAVVPADGSRYLRGPFAPVRDEVTAFDLEVIEGRIPSELEGRYLRNGPNPVSDPDPSTYHWFMGSGMVHGIRLRDGRAEWYRNRWVRSPGVAAELGEPAPENPWADDQVFSANTNVIGHAGRTLALVEAGSPPIEMSYELETARISDLDGTLPKAFSAHPKRNPLTGELHVATYWWGWGNQLQYLIVGTDGAVRTAVDVPLPGAPMVHDIAITEHWAILFDLPCTFDLDVAATGSFPYRWNPEYGARIGLLPIDGSGEARWFEIEPCYVYHPLNAYEQADGKVVLDAVRHPSTMATDVNGPNEGPPTLDRWTLDPTTGRATETRLDDHSQEFPRHDERLLGREHRYGYGAGFEGGNGAIVMGQALKHDLGAGTVSMHDYGPGRTTGEVVFIPASADAAEDDGWLMSLVHDATTDSSELVILHSQDFTGAPVARVALPQRVPLGFHGNWVPDTVTFPEG
ncbi:MAG: carotenoid oxygenase family protein [Acidimicrobiia bacterium]|nr:carotenoid oxygenase family protein [Acidimicrobiia bacterium]MDQ3392097.1 carotenoid oxygenase family protein [Actinomycetota bacterium]